MRGKPSEVILPHPIKEKILYESEVFKVQLPHWPNFSPSYFYFWGHLKTPSCIQLLLKMKRDFTSEFFISVKPSTTAPGPLERCSSL
jgi:hypothetical protein